MKPIGHCGHPGMVENRAAMANRIDGEEAFSVYDHPRVLIFEKTARFDLAHARVADRRCRLEPGRARAPASRCDTITETTVCHCTTDRRS